MNNKPTEKQILAAAYVLMQYEDGLILKRAYHTAHLAIIAAMSVEEEKKVINISEGQIACSGCGKPMPVTPHSLDVDDTGLEGYIANNRPMPSQAWCSEKCMEES